ncbi:MAG: transporter substrate-binding domain-containing protein, partial [Gammaproteobacteria bacterium]|nr:transporter substrate-binding domain-containing protein [Gammaproteobacteria bacterium]
MKKFTLFILSLISIFTLASCKVKNQEVNIICPSGTPLLSIVDYIDIHKEAKVEVAQGSDPLVAAFAKEYYDVIIAPVNLGAKFYNTNGNYVLAKTIVWGNLFIASKNDISSFDDLNGKKLVVFGKNSTPDIIVKAILASKTNVNVEIEYVSDVSEANALLVSGRAEYIVTAEPSISKIKDAKGLNTLDLQDEYSKISGTKSYPQAGIFVLKSKKNDRLIKSVVLSLIESVEITNQEPNITALKAVELFDTFKAIGEDALAKAIP